MIVWSIPAVFAALKMVDMQPNGILRRTPDSTADAGVIISPEDVLTNIIRTVHFALLIVLAFRDRLSLLNSFEKLKVEFCSLDDYLADRQDSIYPLDRSNMLLNFNFHRRGKPTFVIATHTIIRTRFPIPCGTVPACTAELSSRGEVFHHVIPWHYLSSKHFLFRRTCRQTNCLASCIHAENDRLNILSAPIEEPDSERHPFDNLCFLVIQKMTGVCRRAGHQRMSEPADNIDLIRHVNANLPIILMRLI